MKFRQFLETNAELATAFKNKLSGVPQDPSHHPEGRVAAGVGARAGQRGAVCR